MAKKKTNWMSDRDVFGFPRGPVRRWLTEDECETAVSAIGPGTGAFVMGYIGLQIGRLAGLPLGGALLLSSVGAAGGGLASKRVIGTGICKRTELSRRA